jgi:7-carboxy-7-deazaguanine synthase
MQVSEIFQGIDGEVNYWGQGTQTTFIRFGGCNLRCTYCDTKHTQPVENKYQAMQVIEIVHQIETERVTITGGEPLLQDSADFESMIADLLNRGKKISIETNGTIEIPEYIFQEKNISLIVDFKIPYLNKIKFENFKYLRYMDFIKFPIQDGGQFEIAASFSKLFHVMGRARQAFSAVGFTQTVLLEWMQAAKLDWVVFNVQLHKLLELR